MSISSKFMAELAVRHTTGLSVANGLAKKLANEYVHIIPASWLFNQPRSFAPPDPYEGRQA